MRSSSRLICQCGGEVPRPMPPTCPHCGKVIAGVRRPAFTWVWPVLVTAGCFGLLLAGALALVQLFAQR